MEVAGEHIEPVEAYKALLSLPLEACKLSMSLPCEIETAQVKDLRL